MSASRLEKTDSRWIVPFVVALVTLLAFLPTLQGDFVTWDDDRNFLDNPSYRGLGWTQLKWMWTTFHMGHYVPLTWMTLGSDYVLWGMHPAGYHFTNLVLHTANVVVLFYVARRLLRLAGAASTDPMAIDVSAAIAALFFGIHPLRVESVAWVTERRDVLSGLFYSLSVLLYLRFVDRPDRRRRFYWLAVAVFACALLSKGTSVTLPAILLILNVYPLKRLGGEIGWRSAPARAVYIELLPFALLAAGASLLSIVALRPPDQLHAAAKVAVSAYSLAFYVWKTLVPVGLAPLYEMPKEIDPLAARYTAAYVVMVGLTALAWSVRRRWPGVTTAWIAFVVMLLPMLGVVQNGPQIAADRYTYHAAPAVALLVGGGFSVLARRIGSVARIAAGGSLALLGALTWSQTHVWHDSDRVWSRVLQLDENSSIAHIALATLRVKQNRLDEATSHYRRGLEIDTAYAEGYNNFGVALARQGKFAEAIQQYQRALALKPSHDEAHNNWGVALVQQGDVAEAMRHYQLALSLNPNNADTHTNMGNALVRLGRLDEAIAEYQQAVRIRPNHADAHLNWGVALARQNRFADAIDHFRRVLAIQPDNADAQRYLELAIQFQRQQPARLSP
jgi:protein O-mannosyl-transferase